MDNVTAPFVVRRIAGAIGAEIRCVQLRPEYGQQERQRRRQQRGNGLPRIFEDRKQCRLGVLRDLNLQRLIIPTGIWYLLFDAAQRGRGPLPNAPRP
jgi:hypothetical protein